MKRILGALVVVGSLVSVGAVASAAKAPAPIPTLYSPTHHLYRAGEFCPRKDLGKVDHGSDGFIKCVLDKGYDRWVHA